jgi:hypothetical protein
VRCSELNRGKNIAHKALSPSIKYYTTSVNACQVKNQLLAISFQLSAVRCCRDGGRVGRIIKQFLGNDRKPLYFGFWILRNTQDKLWIEEGKKCSVRSAWCLVREKKELNPSI